MVSNLTLNFKVIITLNSTPYITLNPLNQTVGASAPVNSAFIQDTDPWKIEYDYTPSMATIVLPSGHYTQEVELLPSSAYIIIP